MYSAMRRGLSRRRVSRRRSPYVKRSMYQTGNLVARSMLRGGRMRSNYKRKSSRSGSSAVMQYAKSILNPSVLGARIPDDFAQSSAAFQVEKEYIVKGAASGVIMMSLELATLPAFAAYTPATDLISGVAPTASSGVAPQFLGSSDDLKTLLSLYKSCRLVSAGVKVQYSGTDSTNQGVLTCGYLNREFFCHGEELYKVENTETAGGKTYLTAASTQSNYWGLTATSKISSISEKLRTLPVNAYGPAKDGCFCRYFPLDATDIEFRQLNRDITVDATAPLYVKSNQYLYGDTQVPNGWNLTGNNMNYGAFVIIGESLNTDGASFVVKVTCNYEGQIRDEALNLVSTKPSPVSAGAMAKASKIYSRSWQCKVGGNV